MEKINKKEQNTFRIPGDPELQNTYKAYKISNIIQNLYSESKRKIFCEYFIEHTQLGTLADLSVQALGKHFIKLPKSLQLTKLQKDIYVNSLDVEMPLEESYLILEQQYWRNVVLAKSNDYKLRFMKDVNWRDLGLSLKYVELVENCPAEYWPATKMNHLAKLIKNEVTVMHIKKLKSLKESSFDTYFLSETDTDYVTPSGPSSATISTISESDLLSEQDLFDKTDIEEEEEQSSVDSATNEMMQQRRLQLEKSYFEDDEKARRKAEKLQSKALQLERRTKREQNRQIRKAKTEARLNAPPEPKVKQKKQKIRGVFEIEVPSEEPEIGEEIIDRRNAADFLKKRNRFNFETEYCHHIDLSFLMFFEYLEELSIQFQTGELKFQYHPRFYNFSYKDVTLLARGIAALQKLRTFRFRNSRMDAKKLQIIVEPLSHLEYLEFIDFGFDGLADDCGTSFNKLLTNSISLKKLELENNYLAKNVMQQLGIGLLSHSGSFIEYLGLAHNPLGNAGLHLLTSALIRSGQVSDLNLTAIIVEPTGISCCVGNELLRQHKPLRKLDVSCIPMQYQTGVDILKGLIKNNTILYMDTRLCDLNIKLELDIETLLQRNRFILENPYINNESNTMEEIAEFTARIKSPILLNAMDQFVKHNTCLAQRPAESLIDVSVANSITEFDINENDSISRTSKLLRESQIKHKHVQITEASDVVLFKRMYSADYSIIKHREPFVFNPNQFTMDDFKRHVNVPGPGQRYYYFHDEKIQCQPASSSVHFSI